MTQANGGAILATIFECGFQNADIEASARWPGGGRKGAIMNLFHVTATCVALVVWAAQPAYADYVVYVDQTLDGNNDTAAVTVSYSNLPAGGTFCFRNSFGTTFTTCKAINTGLTSDSIPVDPTMLPGDFRVIIFDASDTYAGESVVFHTR
jgi:hypothetical protein